MKGCGYHLGGDGPDQRNPGIGLCPDRTRWSIVRREAGSRKLCGADDGCSNEATRPARPDVRPRRYSSGWRPSRQPECGERAPPFHWSAVDTGVTADHSVNKGPAHQRIPVLVAGLAQCGHPILLALASASVAPTPALRDAAELLHIAVQHHPRAVMLVAPHELPSGTIDMRAARILRRRSRSCIQRFFVAGLVLFGEWCGRELRSCGAVAIGPALHGRPGDLEPGSPRPLPTKRRREVSAALGCDMKEPS